MTTISILQAKYAALAPHLDERALRIWAATEAKVIGYKGITRVHNATKIARSTIHRGLDELESPDILAVERIRKPGGGRKKRVERDPAFPEKLERLVEPMARGDPESPLRWTCKSARRLAGELRQQGTIVGRQTVAQQLKDMKYRLQGNRKTEEGQQDCPDRFMSAAATSAL